MLATLKSTFKQSIIYGLGNLSMKLAGLILLPLYTKELTVDQFGVLGLVDVTSQVLVALLSLTLYSAYFRWYYDTEHMHFRKEMFFSTTALMTVISIIATFAISLYSVDFSRILFRDESYSRLIVLMGVATLLQIIGHNPANLLRLQERPMLFSVTSSIRMLVILVATVWLIVWEKRGIEGIYEGQVIGHGFYLVYLLPYMIKNSRFGLPFKILREMVVYSLPLTLSSVAGVLLNVVDRYILNGLTNDLTSVGIYTLAFKIANFIRVFVISSAYLAIGPILMRKMNDPDNKRFYSKVMTYLGLALLFTALAVSLFSLEITKTFARRPDYWIAYHIIPVLSFATYFAMLKEVAITGLNIAKKSGMIGISLIVSAAINVALNYLLIPYLLFWGAAIANFVSQLALLLIIYWSSQKVYHIPYERGKLFWMFVVGVGVFSVSLLLNELPLWIRLGSKTLLLLSFPFLLYAFGLFEDIESQRIKELWNTWKHPSRFLENLKRFAKSDSE